MSLQGMLHLQQKYRPNTIRSFRTAFPLLASKERCQFQVDCRKESTMFKLQSISAEAKFLAGTKRPRSTTAGPPAEETDRTPAAVIDTGQSQPDGSDDKACFQLLYVRGIPDWANRYTSCSCLSLCRSVGPACVPHTLDLQPAHQHSQHLQWLLIAQHMLLWASPHVYLPPSESCQAV